MGLSARRMSGAVYQGHVQDMSRCAPRARPLRRGLSAHDPQCTVGAHRWARFDAQRNQRAAGTSRRQGPIDPGSVSAAPLLFLLQCQTTSQKCDITRRATSA